MTYKTPGVYVEEISTLPPSVAEVSTAVPAFIGYTEKGEGIVRIRTMLEYQEEFGGPAKGEMRLSARIDGATGTAEVTQVTPSASNSHPPFLLFHALDLYFKNGGGPCYIVSVGNYDATPERSHFLDGLKEAEKEDEPTLLVFPEATRLSKEDYYAVCGQALMQCNKLGDRFAILDVPYSFDGVSRVEEFRKGVGINALKYGAAYHPYIRTTLNPAYDPGKVLLEDLQPGSVPSSWSRDFGGIRVVQLGAEAAPKVKINQGQAEDAVSFSGAEAMLTLQDVEGANGEAVVSAWGAWAKSNETHGYRVLLLDGEAAVTKTGSQGTALEKLPDSMKSIEPHGTSLYPAVKAALAAERVVLPPSAAIAGVYAQVDRDRGVWKAPANVSLMSVIGPVMKITAEDQEDLNVHSSGKSINAIRDFSGKGTLIWGARTLAGNDNEWRYVNVRRLFNMIEESAQKSTAFAVFEPNDANTWLKVKGMIESYLYSLWERGALAGAQAEQAYYVHVGLGRTMTPQDVLEGRMIVEIGIAAVRPAEFIVLRFSHKLQES